jgi:hypothetical protein
MQSISIRNLSFAEHSGTQALAINVLLPRRNTIFPTPGVLMKKFSLLACALVVAASASSASAFADTITFNFSFTGTSGSNPSQNQFTGSGEFVGTATSTPGVYLISSIIGGSVIEGTNVGPTTGSTDTEAITSLLGVGGFSSSSHSSTNDNLLYFPVSSSNNNNSFDQSGLAFTLADGSQVILYNNDGFDAWTVSKENKSVQEQISSFNVTEVAPSTVPEPASLALLGTGVFGIAGIIRRKLSV